MLGTLCTLITALTCVSSVTVVTQKPPVVTLRKGETATMDCNLGSVSDSRVRWYKQIPGGVPHEVTFHIPRSFSAHIDNMLGTLCTVITALTCVSGVTVVTQKLAVVTVRKGETATMDCNLGSVTGSGASWYKQIPGEVPQFVLNFHRSDSSPRYGSGFSSPKFTSTHQSTTDYRLIIKSAEESDSAVYHCKTWDGSVNNYVFGPGTKLIVTGSTLPPPVLTVFPPSKAELQSNKATLLCLSTQSGPFADVNWLVDGNPVSSGISTSTAVQKPDQTFHISSSLSIQTSDWNMNKAYVCKVSLGSQTAEKTINKSGCPADE
ncbi:immunoglobulin lambda-1 light chain-like [Poeciliopsis prolifica]|uniref:immunoglobulin lambda-1 light chain-like n=1 Tax=Poeciliopsis prolifica TaxID=188132 RepID=UPI0024136BE3|nr:immunoglobulin lambda-1 light chain-like [Poeciliopsis prolifica]